MWSVVTGAGTGIGRGLARSLALRGFPVALVGRREGLLSETKDLILRECVEISKTLAPEIKVIAADVSTETGRQTIADGINGSKVCHLVHNAAVISPIETLDEIDLQEWRKAQSINVEGPLFLTMKIKRSLIHDDGSKVLFIGSGAAHKPYHSWGSYCSSKAALHMLWKVFKAEDRFPGVAFGSVRPGVVDTPMQDTLRSTDFHNQELFCQLKSDGKLTSVDEVSQFLSWLLCDVESSEFQEGEWDVRDEHHRHRWNHSEHL